MFRSQPLFCLSNRRVSHSAAHSGILAPETADQIMPATSQQFFGLDTDGDGDSPIRILNLWACECDLLQPATRGCCFDEFVSMAPNHVRQYISAASAAQDHHRGKCDTILCNPTSASLETSVLLLELLSRRLSRGGPQRLRVSYSMVRCLRSNTSWFCNQWCTCVRNNTVTPGGRIWWPTKQSCRKSWPGR